MRKSVGIALGALVIGAVAWSGLWFYGKGAIAKEVEAQAALIRAQGGEAEYETVKVSGFPFGYTGRIMAPKFAATQPVIDLPDLGKVENHYTWSAPWIEAKASVTAPDTIEFVMPDRQSASMVTMVDGEEAQSYPIEMRSKNWRGFTTRVGDGLSLESTADSFSMIAENMEMSDEEQIDIDLMLTGVFVAVDLEDTDADEPIIEFKYTADTQTMQMEGRKAEAPAPMTLELRAKDLVGNGSLDSETVRGGGSLDDLEVSLTRPLPLDFQMKRVEMLSIMPRGAGGEPQEFGYKLDVRDVVLPPLAWMIADPQGVIPRDIKQISVDVTGDAVFAVAPSDRAGMMERLAKTGQVPIDLRGVTLNALKIDALGALAEAKGTGAVKDGKPVGRVDIALTGIPALLEALVKAGRVPPQQAVIGQLMLENFAKKEEGSDTLNFGLEAKDEMIFVNGNPIGTAPNIPQ